MTATLTAFIHIACAAWRWRCTRAAWIDGLVLVLLLLGQRTAVAADTPVSREYQIKAAFLYNIPKFVEWPADSFADANAPLVIGVLGTNPFGNQLELLVNGRKANGRTMVIRQVETVEAAQTTHLLFVADNESARFRSMYPELADRAVLTVGESSSFLLAGGGIRFVPLDDKLRFELNMVAVDRAKLKMSSQLQKLATARRAP